MADAVFALAVPGTPEPQRRARAGRGPGGRARVYTCPEDLAYRQRVIAAWLGAGRPRLSDGPWGLDLEAVWERPASHYRRDGETLSAHGERCPVPTTRADIDNVLKAGLDALVEAGAVPDDRLCVEVVARKRWAVPGEGAYLALCVREATA